MVVATFLIGAPGGTVRAQSVTKVDGEADAAIEYHENCGVNVGYTALRLAGVSADVKSVAKFLRVGQAHERLSSLADLRDLVVSNGITASAVKFDSLTDFAGQLTDGSFLILRTRPAERLMHFVVAVQSSSRDELVLVDPLREPVRVPWVKALEEKRLDGLTGEALVIHPAERRAGYTAGPKFQLITTSVDLGDVGPEEVEISGQVEWRNAGDNVAKIIEVTGPCSCFTGAKGDLELAAGRTGTVKISFDRRKMPAGRLTRTLTLRTNDSLTPKVEVPVKVFIREVGRVDVPRVSPQELVLGRGKASDLSSVGRTLLVTVPAEVDGKPSEIRATSDAPNLQVVQEGDEEIRDPNGTLTRLVRFRVHWNSTLPLGPIKSQISFDVRRPDGNAALVVSVRGDVVP
ncbi:MAG TPA: DUF1573 domain-containing protein [Tepidisphaeraceae bacterium]|nr:DUF1573 domain-containing protein [Tepidisphaeraceae bacterium]